MDESKAERTQQTLTLQTVGDIDRGRVALAFNHAIRMATLDVLDRPADKTARKVHLTVELKPVLDKDSAALDTIDNEFVIKTVVPSRRSSPYPMLATHDGKQLFEPGSPFDPRQSSFTFATTKTKSAGNGNGDDADTESEESPM